MAQGKFKKNNKLPEGTKKKQKKGNAITKRPNAPMQPKKAKFEERHKLKQILTKSVNKAVEDEIRAKAGKADGKSRSNLSKAQQAVAKYNKESNKE